MKMGFPSGRQTDIFDEDGTATTTSVTPTSTRYGPADPNDEDEDSGALALGDALWMSLRYMGILFFLPFLG